MPVLQDEQLTAECCIESARVDVKVSDALLRDIEARHPRQGEGDLAGKREGLGGGGPHDVHGGGRIDHAVRRPRDSFHEDAVQLDRLVGELHRR